MLIGGRGWRWPALVLALCAGILTGCSLNPYFLGEASDGGPGENDDGGGVIIDGGIRDDGGGGDIDADVSDIDAGCVPTTEVCDEIDNDCDDLIDETTNFDQDSENCGACGIRCALLGAEGSCVAAACTYECRFNAVDINGDLNTPNSDGCEYLCLPTAGGVEACDLTDNDCDSDIDEDFGVDTDVLNCGGCGIACAILNTVETCVAGQCGFDDCDTGFADNSATVPGCEYQCPVFPTESETCDNQDDDCDGRIDEDAAGGILGQDCTNPGFEAFGDEGRCTFGAFVCSAGSEVCAGYVGPVAETCNGVDDNCNGDVDENFDKLNNPNTCGPTCTVCLLDNANEGCTAGVCTVSSCLNGFVDLDGLPANGCEYQCTETGPEVCDGRDNDCDGLTDAADNVGPTVFVAAPAGFCNQNGACSGTTPVCSAAPACDGLTKFRCPYPGTTEADGCNLLPPQELRCDGTDGDCDGAIDEAFITLGTGCTDGETGACLGTGQFECRADTLGTECVIDAPGLTAAAQEFECDNIDEDCDGNIDEGAPDSVVGIDSNGDNTPDFFIDAYEASRPDATADNAGGAEHRACSTPGVLPWGSIGFVRAEAACTAAGKRLCSETEWELACEGLSASTYPYGDVYDRNACNGNDFDQDCGVGPDADELLITGFTYGCPTPLATCEQTDWNVLAGNDSGTFDMAGNLKEWTSTTVGTGARRIRGGAFNSTAAGMTCQFDFVSADESFFFSNLGFRCCSN